METTASLNKKTKAELISAYEDLVTKQKTLEASAAQAYGPTDAVSFKKAAAAFSPEHVQKTITSLNAAAQDAVHSFAKAFEAEVRRFDELQHAVSLAEERLKLAYELEAGAAITSELVARFEEERGALEREIAARKRDWEREQEEASYQAELARKRAVEAMADEARKRDAAFKERDGELKEWEASVAAAEKAHEASLKRVEGIPAELDREAAKRVAEAKKQWEVDEKRALAEKDLAREHALKLSDLEKKNLQQELARVQAECAALRKDAEAANRKAQELAVRIVERGTGERPTALQQSADVVHTA